MNCDLIFVLNDGTELMGKEKIEQNIHLFPPNILETVKPVFFQTLQEVKGWNKSVIRVFQDGRYSIIENIPPDLPFSING